jgi:hypothetical protein
MAIKIIEDGADIHLTRSEWEKLHAEYQQGMSHMVNPPSFETWVSKRKAYTPQATYPDWMPVLSRAGL